MISFQMSLPSRQDVPKDKMCILLCFEMSCASRGIVLRGEDFQIWRNRLKVVRFKRPHHILVVDGVGHGGLGSAVGNERLPTFVYHILFILREICENLVTSSFEQRCV